MSCGFSPNLPVLLVRRASDDSHPRYCQDRQMFDAEAFEAWFVHDKLILDLLTPAENQDLMLRLAGPAADLPEARRRRAFEEALASFFARVDVPSLDVQHMRGTLSRGQLVWFEQAIAFKGVGAARSSIAEGKPRNAT